MTVILEMNMKVRLSVISYKYEQQLEDLIEPAIVARRSGREIHRPLPWGLQELSVLGHK